jgi:hypothetical protein
LVVKVCVRVKVQRLVYAVAPHEDKLTRTVDVSYALERVVRIKLQLTKPVLYKRKNRAVLLDFNDLLSVLGEGKELVVVLRALMPKIVLSPGTSKRPHTS